jgi:hypothetical protein
VVVFQVTDKRKEIDFVYDNRPYKFTDLESGQEVKILPDRVREHYLSGIESFRKELILRCGQYSIDLVEADINAPFSQVLLPYLVKRSKLF